MEQNHGESDGNINISDVIEVIQTTDPDFSECNGEPRQSNTMFSGGGVEAVGRAAAPPGNHRVPTVVILEQPASKALRFRYECEGRSAGSIPGVNSTPENKTFPTIRVEGYKGRAVVVVSCVTKDEPHRPHPHNLVGKESCRSGVCTIEIVPDSMTVTFANLGIQCVKKKDIEEALKVREKLRVDPFGTGFAHRAQPTSIDLNAVRLCFQVFIEGTEKGKYTRALAPVVSDTIFDKKAMSDLVICKLSDCCCTVAGGKEMILLCEKVAKEDIQVRFFEKKEGQLVWEGFADFQPTHVHKQVAISFRAPRYRVLEVEQPVKVLIQLRRPSDGATSDSLPFEYLPLDSDPKSKRKRKYTNPQSAHVLRHLQAEVEKHGAMQYQALRYDLNPIKSEPADPGSSPYQVPQSSGISPDGFSSLYRVERATPSPQPGASLQPYGQQHSPGRTPSPMDYLGGIGSSMLPMLQQHQQQDQQHFQQHFNVPLQFPTTQQHPYMLPQPMMLDRMNTEQTGAEYLAPVNPGNIGGVNEINMLNLDNQQSSFELSTLNQLNSTDLAGLGFDENLSQNLSSNLSLSDIRVSQAETCRTTGAEAANIAGGNVNNMSDSFSRLATSAIHDICQLNSMFDPSRDNNG